jgi:hypothetical protein
MVLVVALVEVGLVRQILAVELEERQHQVKVLLVAMELELVILVAAAAAVLEPLVQLGKALEQEQAELALRPR